MNIFKSIIGTMLFTSCVAFASCSDEEKMIYDKDVNLTLSSSAVILPYDGGSVNINIESGYFWKIYGDTQWCDFSTIEGEPGKPESVSIVVGENNTDAARYISLKVKSGYESKDLVVLQTGRQYVQPDRSGMEHSAADVIYSINNGWNLGNTLEARDDSKWGTGVSMETAWGNPAVTKELIDKIHEYGFNGIRIPCGWQYQLINDTDPESPDYCKIHPDWMARVKEVVDYCLADKPDMKVFLNMHHCEWIDGSEALTESAVETSEPRMFKVWTQIAEAFRDYDDRLIFGACNEPDSKDLASAEILKRYQQAFVNAVRATGGRNAYRKLIVQAPCTNTGYALSFMQLVSDFVPDCLGMEVHFYEPMLFCIGEDTDWGTARYFWGKDYLQQPIKGVDRNSPENEEAVDEVLSKLKAKFVDNGLPIIAGEYGATHKNLSFSPTVQKIHDESIAYYHKYVVSKLKENGLVPFLWDTGSTINRNTLEVIDQILFDAIIEGAKTDYPDK